MAGLNSCATATRHCAICLTPLCADTTNSINPKPPAFSLYVDQGEELYARAEESQRQRFSEILAHALPDPRLRSMMSMRSDFLGGLQNDEPLFNAHRQINVPPMREAELRKVVSRPAELLSAHFDTPWAGGHHYPAHCRGFGQGRGRVAAAFLHAGRHVDADGEVRRRRASLASRPILRTRRRARRPGQHVSGRRIPIPRMRCGGC